MVITILKSIYVGQSIISDDWVELRKRYMGSIYWILEKFGYTSEIHLEDKYC
jgi:hypothetical protein